MKKVLFRAVAAILCAVLVIVSAGCSLGTDIDNLLRPPRLSGEYLEIQNALETWINSKLKDDKLGNSGGYVLKYPRSGDLRYRSSVMLEDIDGDGVNEAIVLYQYGSKNSNVRLHLLKNINGKWQSAGDVEGVAPDIESIQFADLFGNGTRLMLTGWAGSDAQSKMLLVYSLIESEFENVFDSMYTEWVVDDFTGCGHDNLLLLSVNIARNTALARLWGKSSSENSLFEMGVAELDGYIGSFTSIKVEPAINPNSTTVNNSYSPRANKYAAVYADAIKQSGGMITELIYWDGVRLVAPLYDSKKKANEITLRQQHVPSMDIDKNGRIDWPVYTTVLQENAANEGSQTMDRTDWMVWNYDNMEVEVNFSCILNYADYYYLRIGDSIPENAVGQYSPVSHTLHVYVGSEKILEIRAVHKSAETSPISAPGDSSNVMQELKSTDTIRYEAWFTDNPAFGLTAEQLNYIFLPIVPVSG